MQPRCHRFARGRDVTALLVERAVASNLVVAAVAEGTDKVSVKVTVGTAFPSLSSATGRCEAAYAGLGEAALRARFERLRWQNAPDSADWRKDERRVPACGYAVDRGNDIRGLNVISAPVHVHGTAPDRCIAAVALKERMSPGRQTALIEALRVVARESGDIAF